MITGGEGEVGKKVQELTAGLGVAGIEAGRCGDGGSTENRAGAARSEAAAAFRQPECRKAAKKWLGSFHA
jgi:hypothetical protein